MGLISIIYWEFQKLNNKKQTTQFKMGKDLQKTFPPKDYISIPSCIVLHCSIVLQMLHFLKQIEGKTLPTSKKSTTCFNAILTLLQ